MQSLRCARRLTRLVLVWFALTMAEVVASALVKPVGFQLVCSGSSVKLVVGDVDSDDGPTHRGMDCPLCGGSAVPLPVVTKVPLVCDRGPRPFASTTGNGTTLCQPPLPARGPPVFS